MTVRETLADGLRPRREAGAAPVSALVSALVPALVWGLASVLAMAGASLATAQTYPTRPVRLIVGFPAGGGTDLVARAMAPRLGEIIGQSVLVDNRDGANGRIAAEFVAKAKPDGTTLLFTTHGSLVISPHISRKPSYDPLRDFAPITMVARSAPVLVVHASVGATTVNDLVALAKSRPGELFYASSGVGGPNHLAGVLFNKLAGTAIEHVAYRGTAPATNALLGAQVAAMFAVLPAVLSYVRSGRMHALGVGGPQRSAAMPEVPTIAEAGLPGYELTTWFGLLGPAGMPSAMIAGLRQAVVTALEAPEIKEFLAREGAVPVAGTPDELAQAMRADHAKYGALLEGINIQE